MDNKPITRYQDAFAHDWRIMRGCMLSATANLFAIDLSSIIKFWTSLGYDPAIGIYMGDKKLRKRLRYAWSGFQIRMRRINRLKKESLKLRYPTILFCTEHAFIWNGEMFVDNAIWWSDSHRVTEIWEFIPRTVKSISWPLRSNENSVFKRRR